MSMGECNHEDADTRIHIMIHLKRFQLVCHLYH